MLCPVGEEPVDIPGIAVDYIRPWERFFGPFAQLAASDLTHDIGVTSPLCTVLSEFESVYL